MPLANRHLCFSLQEVHYRGPRSGVFRQLLTTTKTEYNGFDLGVLKDRAAHDAVGRWCYGIRQINYLGVSWQQRQFHGKSLIKQWLNPVLGKQQLARLLPAIPALDIAPEHR